MNNDFLGAKLAWVILSKSNLSKIDAKHNNEDRG